jgi:hypothetical protein
MTKSVHQMSGWEASAPPKAAFEEEQAWEATRQVSPATHVMAREDGSTESSGPMPIGRRLTDSQWEMFVACEPADALQQLFESAQHDYIVLHDIGTQSSRRMLQGLAAAMHRPVHQLHVRRQGVGMPLARVEFIELPVGTEQPALRLYTSETDADTAQRRRLARTLLAYSRLGVVMVQDLPPHALATALMPLRDAIVDGPWNNRELLMLPLAGASSLAGAAAQLGRGSSVKIRTTPAVTRPSEAWGYLRAAWNRLRDALAAEAIHVPELLDLPTAPATATAAIPHAQAAAVPAAAARTPLPMQPMPAVRSGVGAPAPVVADPVLANYLRKCGELKGMVSCCIFELATQRTIGHIGTRPGPAGLAAHGASLLATMAETAQALNLGSDAPDAAITLGHHHVLLRAVPARRGLAMHAVLDKSQANLTLVRLQLQRLDLMLEEGAA